MRLQGGKFLATSPSAYLASPTPGLDAQKNFVDGKSPAIIAAATAWCARMKSSAAVGLHRRRIALTSVERGHLIHQR